MGKSELINYWVHTYGIHHYKNIVHLSCGDGIANALNNVQDELQSELELDDASYSKPKNVKQALKKLDSFLLVLDNLPWQDDLYDAYIDEIDDFCTPFTNILASSRRSYKDIFTDINIAQLDKDSAIQLFKSHCRHGATENDADIIAILERAGWHTLLIELLAKTAKSQGLNACQLLEKLTANNFDYSELKTPVNYRKTSETGNRHKNNIHDALTDLFSLAGLDDAQKMVLFHLSAFNSNVFSLDRVQHWLDDKLTGALNSLPEMGWLQEQKNSEHKIEYQLHESITHTIASLFDAEYAGKRDKQLQLMLAVSERMQDDYQARDHTNLHEVYMPTIASYLGRQVNIASCEKHANNYVDAMVDACNKLNIFAVFCDNKAFYNLAIELLTKQQLTIAKAIGETHPDYAAMLNNLAGLYQSKGTFDKALPLYEQDLIITKKVLGDMHPDYAQSFNNLAVLYQNMGAYDKALPLYEECLIIIKNALGKTHPDYAQSLNNIAELYRNMGAYDKALPLYKECLIIIKNALGKTHRYYAATLNNLAILYNITGAYDKALHFFEECLIIYKDTLGETHPDYAATLNNVAALYENMGAQNKALLLYQNCLIIKKNALSETHPDYAIT